MLASYMLIHFYQFLNNLKSTPARKSKLIVIALIVAAAFNLLTWLLLYFKLLPAAGTLPTEQAYIPLHYNIYLGVDSFGDWRLSFIMPGAGLAFLIANAILAFSFYNKKEIAGYILCLAAAFAEILIFVSTIFVVLINI